MADAKRRINTHLIEHPLDEWAAARGAALVYPDGQAVELGDQVDFGVRPEQLGADPVEGPWAGEVTEVRLAEVVVDTHLNSVQAFDPRQLRLLGRAEAK